MIIDEEYYALILSCILNDIFNKLYIKEILETNID